MPQTQSQSKILSQILCNEDTPIDASDQAIANTNSSSTSQLESIPESSTDNSAASIEASPNPSVLNLESYKRTQDREEPPPTPKRVRFEPPQVSPLNRHRASDSVEHTKLLKDTHLESLKKKTALTFPSLQTYCT